MKRNYGMLCSINRILAALTATALITACSYYGYPVAVKEETPKQHQDRSISMNLKDKQHCGEWKVLKLGEYELHNNVWGKGSITNFRQCVFTKKPALSDYQFGWSWNWPEVDYTVKSYPSVLYGRKPWNDYSTTHRLPVKVSKLESLKVEYALSEQSVGAMNLLLELWVTDTPTPSPYNRTREIAIHMYQKEWPAQGGDFVESLVIDETRYDFHKNDAIIVPGDDHKWAYLAFVNSGWPKYQAKVDVKKFVDYLVENGHMSKDEYIVSVELGNEITEGQGETKVKKFQVDVVASEYPRQNLASNSNQN